MSEKMKDSAIVKTDHLKVQTADALEEAARKLRNVDISEKADDVRKILHDVESRMNQFRDEAGILSLSGDRVDDDVDGAMLHKKRFLLRVVFRGRIIRNGAAGGQLFSRPPWNGACLLFRPACRRGIIEGVWRQPQ